MNRETSMRHASRSGSAFLFSLALAAMAVVLGYGFLRASMRDSIADDASRNVLLAQAAAKAGLAEATRTIIEDYASTSLVVARGAASAAGSTISIADPPTFLDGPYRAPFVSLLYPNRLSGGIDVNTTDAANDVGAWNMVANPLVKQFSWDYTGQTTQRTAWYDNGGVYWDGRGRWIEPGFHHEGGREVGTMTPKPVSVTKFLTMDDALGFSSPSRHNGLFLDSALNRIDSTGSLTQDQDARAAARYRLRFAVGVIDLSGHLLSNPKPDMNIDWQDRFNEYRSPPLWLQEAGEAWYNMTKYFPTYIYTGWSAPGSTAPLRWQHVFLGRGNAGNFDRRYNDGSKKVTFPLMFRLTGGVRSGSSESTMYTTTQRSTPAPKPMNYWGLYGAKLADQWPTQAWVGEAQGLYNHAAWGGEAQVKGLAAGNEEMPLFGNYDRLCHALLGPQTSWFNQQQSVQGALSGFADSLDGAFHYGETGPLLETAMFIPTPFGRGVSEYAGGAARKWYEGPVTTPWYVNLLTAPPVVIRAMLAAYLPPSFKRQEYYENFALAATPTTWMLSPGNLYSPPSGHDLFTSLAGPAFSEWTPPMANDGGSPTTPYPNFQINEPRSWAAIYPGPMWNGSNDNLAQNINADSLIGSNYYCSILGGFSGAAFTTTITNTGSNSSGALPATGYQTTPPPGWGAAGDVWQRTAISKNRSYWYVVMRAFASAVAVTRAAWLQFPTNAVPLATLTASDFFKAPLVRDPTLYDSIEEFDRLFLRQLGEDFDNPGGSCTTPIICSGATNQKYSEAASAVSNNIKSLVVGDLIAAAPYTSAERGALMERVLNDFRLSFFGASPQYYARFRPIDFDNDGKAMCSCYAPSGDAAEKAKGLDRYSGIEADTATYGIRRGLVPTHWFSLTGTFFIGKSHYYRVICRGEVFDSVLNRPVSDATLESVLVVDPEGDDIRQSHTLFQRWHYDRAAAHLSQLGR